jgi:transcription antitermination factor NusA-like protein
VCMCVCVVAGNEEMTRDHLKMLLDESQIPIVSIEEVRMRTTMPGSRSFVARVSNMRLAQKTVEEWNNKIVSGSRLQITIMDERFSDGAGDSGPQQHQEPGSMMYTPNDDVVTDVGNFDIPLRILIPNEFVGAIIGRGGTTIKAISKGTGARLDIYRQHNRNYEMPEKPVSISGPREKASQACRKVLEIIAQEADHMRERKFDIALKLFVPNGVVGRIIGKAGSVIKEMMDVTQTKIHISNQPEYMEDSFNARRSNQRIITIRGSIDGMCQAESMISAKLREAYIEGKVRDRDLEFAYPSPSRNTSTMGYVGVSPMITNPYLLPTPPHSNYPYERRYNNQLYGVRFNSSSNYPMDPEDDGLLSRPEVAYMYVPDEIVGALIGRKGESIREIIHASGASIKILEGVVYVHDYPSRRVVIHGGNI